MSAVYHAYSTASIVRLLNHHRSPRGSPAGSPRLASPRLVPPAWSADGYLDAIRNGAANAHPARRPLSWQAVRHGIRYL
ncbi:hypothetical protein BKA80DRAFT_278754 [Phyllosticta citrichinensis]